jgi:hypothetical protein
MCSILCWILSNWEALGCIFPMFGLIHALPTRGRWLWRKSTTGCIYKVSGRFQAIFGLLQFPDDHQSNRLWSPVQPVMVLILCRCCALVWPMLWTSLTRQSWADAAAMFCEEVCIHSFRRGCIGLGGSCMCVRGVLCGFWVLFCWCLLVAWACFCLGCVELLPLPKGTKTCLLQVIFLFAFPLAFDHLLEFFFCSFPLFSFSLFGYQMCVLSMHSSRGRLKTCVVWGPVDGHILVWGVIDNVVWTNSWLSIAGAGCGLTSFDANEEQDRKVDAGEASRCGADK